MIWNFPIYGISIQLALISVWLIIKFGFFSIGLLVGGTIDTNYDTCFDQLKSNSMDLPVCAYETGTFHIDMCDVTDAKNFPSANGTINFK